MKRIFYVVLATWVWLIRVKRWVFPRPFRMILIRRRCLVCHRRLRARITKDAPGRICRRCAPHAKRHDGKK